MTRRFASAIAAPRAKISRYSRRDLLPPSSTDILGTITPQSPRPAMTEDGSPPPDITQLLHRASQGDSAAFGDLLPLVYDQLKEIAAGRLRWERDSHTLNATALVHEAYLKLVDQSRVQWQSRAHFYAVASQAMRRILIDYAKARHRGKRGGKHEPVSLDTVGDVVSAPREDERLLEILELDTALNDLKNENARAAEIVEYRFFGGLTNDEIAEVLGVSEVTVRRSWQLAKLWLRRALDGKVDPTSTLMRDATS